MTVRRAALEAVLDSVADGTTDFDWAGLEAQLHDERHLALFRHLRILAQISDVQRSETQAIDEAALLQSAKVMAHVLPIEARARALSAQGAAEPAPAPTLPRWGRFELLECIGQGSFADVYRAFDTRLQREVAVKILHPDSPQERMLEEARALARVDHENVVTVHDAELRDGRVGICMEFIRGKTLQQILLTQGTRDAREAALIGQDLCQALSAVHAAGLVHRDIKAQNVMREDGGRIVLMDFGAGQTLGGEPANPSRLTGTPAYIAPEVLAGAQASVRSDIYSLGVLLYHLVTSDFPVWGRSYDDLCNAHREGRVQRLRDVAPKVPGWFVRVVERAIAPDPRDRYASVGELEAALARQAWFNPRPLMFAAAVTLAVGAVVVATWPTGGGSGTRPPLVVLLPLDAGPGVESPMAHAITDEIYQALATIDTLRVSSPQSAANAKTAGLTMVEVANRLRASAVVAGTVSDAGKDYEVKLRLFRAGSDSPSWTRTFPALKTNPSSVRLASALSIAGAIDVDVSPRNVARLGRPLDATKQAYDAYALGRAHQARAGRSDLERARIEFERTIELEPSFARAYAALARVHLDLGARGPSDWTREGPLAKLAARKALALEPDLAEAHAALGQVAFLLDWNWTEAESWYRRALAASPSDDFARQRYAQFLAARGRIDQALVELTEAQRLDPYSETTDMVMVSVLQYARRFQEAETLALAIAQRFPNPNAVHSQLGRIYAHTGRFDAAIEEFQKRTNAASGDPYTEAEIASAHAGAGRVVEAQTIFDRLSARARSEDVPPDLFALISVRLGRTDDAFRYLEEAIELKSRRIVWMKVDPRWDPLRSDPRFEALVKRLRL